MKEPSRNCCGGFLLKIWMYPQMISTSFCALCFWFLSKDHRTTPCFYSVIHQDNKTKTKRHHVNGRSADKADAAHCVSSGRENKMKQTNVIQRRALTQHIPAVLWAPGRNELCVAMETSAAQAHNIPPWMESRTASTHSFVPVVETLMVAQAWMFTAEEVCSDLGSVHSPVVVVGGALLIWQPQPMIHTTILLFVCFFSTRAANTERALCWESPLDSEQSRALWAETWGLLPLECGTHTILDKKKNFISHGVYLQFALYF